MAIAKKPKQEPSCPLWLATYGDMVTNMLVFFVLLLSMSEIKKDELFIDFMQAVQEAFGYIGGMEQVPLEDVLSTKNVPLAQMMIIPIDPKQWSKTDDQGVQGHHSTVKHIRPPDRYDQAGKLSFGELSAEVVPAVEAEIAGFAQKLRGLRTQIEVRGHCNPRPVDGTGFADHFALSYERARAVAQLLIREGIEPERILIVAASTHEPVTTGNYNVHERQENDIVEVLQVNRRVEEFGTPGERP